MNSCSVTPASYNNAKGEEEIEEAFHDNKDFILHDVTSRWDGKPCNKQDLTGDYDFVEIRDRKKQLIAGVELN